MSKVVVEFGNRRQITICQFSDASSARKTGEGIPIGEAQESVVRANDVETDSTT